MPIEPCVENSAACTPCAIVKYVMLALLVGPAIFAALAAWSHYRVWARIKGLAARKYRALQEWDKQYEGSPAWAYGLTAMLIILVAAWAVTTPF